MDDRRDKRKPGSPGPAREQRATQSKKADEASANTPDQSLRGRSLSDYKPGGPLSADQPEPTTGDARRHGGLLSRFAGWRRHAKPDGATSQSAPPADRTGRPDQEDAGQEQRAPRAGDWRASDFEQHELEVWDRYNAAPFELPEAPDDTYERIILDARKQRQRSRSGFSHGAGNANQDEDQDEDDQDEDRDVDDVDDADAAWEEGWDDTWATQDDSWLNEASPDKKSKSEKGRRATDEEENDSDDPPQRGQSARERGGRSRPRDQGSSRPDTFFRLTRTETTTAFGAEIGWLRRLLRRRPASAATLAFLLLAFLLIACAPLVTITRLGYDAADAAVRVSRIQHILAGGTSQLLNPTTLESMQGELAGLSQDLAEINAAVQFVGAPATAISSTARNYTYLMRIGSDLATAGNETLQSLEIILTPLQGGALSSSGPGLRPADLVRARSLIASADGYVLDALYAYDHLNPATLPHQLRPGTKYGNLLADLPKAPGIFAELTGLIDAAPSLLGVGQPAYFLVIAMDSTELRPGGGFQGNYGILQLDGGKQSATHRFSLGDTYTLDAQYAEQHTQSSTADANCPYTTPEAPNYYWWWPIRCIAPPAANSGQLTFGWGLRDSNLSPDFPTNARAAIQIAESAGATPNDAPLQGVIAFTPGLIQAILRATGNLSVQFNGKNVIVTPANLEFLIHEYQLGAQETTTQGRKQFTHELASALLTRLKSLHGAALKPIIKLALNALKTKDLQVYLSDPRAETLLQQFGLASTISTGSGDGFYVVDTNVGGNKANAYVTEQQTDLVTLLPNDGALHQLEITVTYDKTGSVYSPDTRDYNDVQRVYLPSDATLLGWSGYNPTYLSTSSCPKHDRFASIITDCSQAHGIYDVSTSSDVPGRTMVLGAITLLCGKPPFVGNLTNQQDENAQCDTNPQPHTVNIFLAWYTPHAYTTDAQGHIHYSELIERQPGANDTLTVYITRANSASSAVVTDPATFASLLQGAKKIYDQPLDTNTSLTYTF